MITASRPITSLAPHYHVNTLQVLNAYDPTQTTTIRRRFEASMNRRFMKLRGLVRRAIVEQDCLGLQHNGIDSVTTNAALPGHRAFAFERSADKVEAFIDWVRQSVKDNVLETVVLPGRGIGSGVETPWSNIYLTSAYQKGIADARRDMLHEGYDIPEVEGGVRSVFNQPVHADRAGLIYTRTYTELRGVTDQMANQMSQVLAQGIIDGKGPRDIARLLNKTISGAGGTLDLVDTLGRFIPAQRRAQTIARTEVIRAHHIANVQEMRNFGVAGVSVQVEFRTAGDDRVCDICAGLQGQRYTLEEIEGMLPVHPNCRCKAFPISRREAERLARSGGPAPTPAPTPTPTPAPAATPATPARTRTTTPRTIPPPPPPRLQPFENIQWGDDIVDADAVRHRFKDQYNIDIEGVAKDSPQWQLRYANMTGHSLEDIYATSPALRTRAQQGIKSSNIKLSITNSPPSAYGYQNDGVLGFYSPGAAQITTLKRSMERTSPSLTIGIGEHNIGIDFQSIMRHEYGHAVHHRLLSFDNWDKIKKTYNRMGTDVIAGRISHYAATNPHEMFAEMFSAWTSPLYGVPNSSGSTIGRVLPEWAEELMISVLGPRGR